MGSPAPEQAPFSVLPSWRMPLREIVFSYGTEAILVAFLAWIPVLHHEVMEAPKKDLAIQLVPTPAPVPHEPQRRLPPKQIVVAKLDPPPAALRLSAPQPQPRPKVEDAPAPEVKIAEKKLEPLPSTAPVIPKTIKTGTFSTGSSAPQTVNLPAQRVQTGGFGDPNGVPARATQGRAINIASAGGFDMPTGAGYGNGTGGANGVRGVVASTGFGNGVAVGESHPSAPRSTVRQAGFGANDVPAPPTVQSRPTDQSIAKIIPAEILSKPLPIYTEEARAKKIEGEVLLEVVFEATGKLHVVKVVRGLGHGLDDAAVRAAEQIRFKPALRDGQPSDSTAVLHIIFQLA